MSKIAIYVCDRCGQEERNQTQLPEEWVQATVEGRRIEGVSRRSERKTWCKGCWMRLREKLPQPHEEFFRCSM